MVLIDKTKVKINLKKLKEYKKEPVSSEEQSENNII